MTDIEINRSVKARPIQDVADQLGIQTSEFYVKEASQFIEFLNAFAAMRGVVFKDSPAMEGA